VTTETKTEPVQALTAPEFARRSELEATIEKGQKTFVEVGLALMEIREARLYRSDFDTFETYCQSKWGWGRVQSHRLIEAADTVKDLPESVTHWVTNERQARELAKVPKKQRAKVLKVASEGGEKPVTAKKIAETAKSFAPPPIQTRSAVEPPRLDKFGHLISSAVVPAWDRAEAWAKQALALVSDLRTSMKEFNTDHVFAELSQTLPATINGLYTNLEAVQPHTVCPRHEAKGCKLCSGRGFISKSLYDNAIKPADREKWEAKRAA
jgi:hypothetical protein